MFPLSKTHLLSTATACVRKVSSWGIKEFGFISIVIVQIPGVRLIRGPPSLVVVGRRLWAYSFQRIASGIQCFTVVPTNLPDLVILLEART